MPECPKCGNDVKEPVKTWTMDRQKKTGETWTTEIAQFKCPKCGKPFRKGTRIK